MNLAEPMTIELYGGIETLAFTPVGGSMSVGRWIPELIINEPVTEVNFIQL